MLTHRQLARRKSAKVQILAVGLLLAAGAAAAPPLARLVSPGEPPKFETTAPIAAPSTNANADLPLATASAVLTRLGNPVAPPAPTVVDPNPTDVAQGSAPAPAVVPAAGEWVYVGFLASPTKRSALVRIDNEQKILTIGQEASNHTVKTIEPDYIEVEASGQTKRLELAQRTMLVPMDGPRRPGMPPNAAAAAAAAARAGAGPMVMTQPVPNNFDQARQAALEAARRAQMQTPATPPPRNTKEAEPMDAAANAKALADPGVSASQRLAALRAFGITPGMPYEEAIGRLKSNLDVNEEILKGSLELLEQNAAGKLNEESDK